MRAELRYSFRQLIKSPGFTLVAVLTLALGIGATTAIMSAVRGILLQPLPLREPASLLRLYSASPRTGRTALSVAVDALYANTQSDVVTGLRARTTLGAPDWDALVADAVERHRPDPVHLFFCGPDGLARVLRRAASRHGVVFRQEHF